MSVVSFGETIDGGGFEADYNEAFREFSALAQPQIDGYLKLGLHPWQLHGAKLFWQTKDSLITFWINLDNRDLSDGFVAKRTNIDGQEKVVKGRISRVFQEREGGNVSSYFVDQDSLARVREVVNSVDSESTFLGLQLSDSVEIRGLRLNPPLSGDEQIV